MATRVIGGSTVEPQGFVNGQHGWVPEGAQGAVRVPLEYLVEGVQHYSALYTGERRFNTFSGQATLKSAQCQGTVPILVQGMTLEAQQDAGAFQEFNQSGVSQWQWDEISRLPAPCGS